MNNSIDNVSQACEQASAYVEEHPWQIAALAAYPIGGVAYLAGQLGKNGMPSAAEVFTGGASGLASLVITDRNAHGDQNKADTSSGGLKESKAASDEPNGRAVDAKNNPHATALEGAAKAAVEGVKKGGMSNKSEATTDEHDGQSMDAKNIPHAAAIEGAAKAALEGAKKGGMSNKSEPTTDEPNGRAIDAKGSPQAAGLADAARKASEIEHH